MRDRIVEFLVYLAVIAIFATAIYSYLRHNLWQKWRCLRLARRIYYLSGGNRRPRLFEKRKHADPFRFLQGMSSTRKAMTLKDLFLGLGDDSSPGENEESKSVATVNFSKLTDTQLIMVALSELQGWCPEPNEDLINELKRRIKEEKKP